MVDFKRLGSPSQWKSGPLFSTGTTEAELMVSELRLNLRTRTARFASFGLSGLAWKFERGVHPRLSTAFAERLGQPSPGAVSSSIALIAPSVKESE